MSKDTTKLKEKVLISFNEKGFSNALNKISIGKIHYQKIYDSWKGLGISELTKEEIETIIFSSDAKTFLNNQLESRLSKLPTYGGFSLKKSSLIDQLEIGDTESFFFAVEDAKHYFIKNSFDTSILTLKDGKFDYQEIAFKQLEESFKVYCKNEEEEQIFKGFIKIVDSLQSFNALPRIKAKNFLNVFLSNPRMYFNVTEKGIEPNEYQLQQLLK